jgi:hypothetical protein
VNKMALVKRSSPCAYFLTEIRTAKTTAIIIPAVQPAKQFRKTHAQIIIGLITRIMIKIATTIIMLTIIIIIIITTITIVVIKNIMIIIKVIITIITIEVIIITL